MKNRWVILGASIVIQIILGGIYAWSVFTPPLCEGYGLTTGGAGLIFGATVAVFTLAMIFAGRIQDARGPRLTAGIGAILFGLGYIIASFSGGSLPLLILGIGVVSGAGIGFGYVCPLATSMKWFPRHKGLISGVAVAGFGGGAIFLSKGASLLLDRGMDVLEIFRLIGIAPGLVAFGASMLLVNPGADPEKKQAEGGKRIDLKAILFSRTYLVLFTGMFAGTFGGLLIVGNLKPIGLAGGMAGQTATLGIGLFAIGNAIGRVGWGGIMDRIGFLSIPLCLVMLGFGALLFLGASSPALFLTATVLSGMSFGGCFVLFAARVAGIYGTNHFGSVYPLVFLSYGISGITGPTLAGWIYAGFGSFTAPIALSIAIAWLSALLTWRLGAPGRKQGR